LERTLTLTLSRRTGRGNWGRWWVEVNRKTGGDGEEDGEREQRGAGEGFGFGEALEADEDDDDGDDEEVEEGIAAGELGDLVEAVACFVREIGEAAGGDEDGEEFGVGEDHAEDEEDGGEEEVVAVEELADAAEEGEGAGVA
jgi:hypothetical protein